MGVSKKIRVEVAYARPDRQKIIALAVDEGSTLREIIHVSGILTEFPEINLETQSVGIFSKKRSLDDIAEEGDRIEIYRSLTIDPKDARRARAKKKIAGKC